MLFNTFDFFLFFLVVLAVQAVLPHRPRNVFLLGASWFFYGCWDWRFLLLFVASTVFDYVASHQLHRSEGSARRAWLVGSLAVNLGVLGLFKYFHFGMESAEQAGRWMGLEFSPPVWNIVLPVGISFYTFQSMGYVIDVYRKHAPPIKRFDDFALYLAFFPQLVAGPIERATELAPQIVEGRRARWEDVSEGSWLIVKGLVKKAVLADNLAPIVDRIFSSQTATGPEVLLGTYAFAFQIYGDFAGYTDIARGTARFLGYRLMLNFRLPYFAVSPSDFWQRWHLSLSTWLRDYLYISLGGNRHGLAMTCRNLMITMTLGGLWHGAKWTFVVWGLYHGALLVLFRLAASLRKPAAARPGSLRWALLVVGMFHLTCLGWLLFRAESLGQAARFLAALPHGWNHATALTPDAWRVAILCVPILLFQLLEELTGRLNLVHHLSLVPRAAIYATTVLCLLALGQFGGREFIYFQF